LTIPGYVATCGHMRTSKRVLGPGTAPPSTGDRLEESPPLPARPTVSVREAKDQLSHLLQRAARGEEIVITSDGEPKAMLVRHRPAARGKPWASLAAFRAQQTRQPDSTALLDAARAERS